MATLRLSTKGQIVIPNDIRTRHQWQPGTELIIEDLGDALVLRAASPFPPTRLEEGLGCAAYRGPAKSVDEMDAAVGEALRREWARRDLR
jgi:AbrB family looped-hinge helix DNA binding protein